MSQTIGDQKQLCRKQVKKVLDEISSEEIEKQSKSITTKVLNLDQFKKARSISIFLSMPGREVSTREILLHAFQEGKSVFVPFMHSTKHTKFKSMDMLRLRDQTDLDSLKPDVWGIPSIAAESVLHRENALGGLGCLQDRRDDELNAFSSLDLIFMPGVAFDQSCHRLGHGKGFYDRYLTNYEQLSHTTQQKPQAPYLVGLALREQLLSPETLPVTQQDWKVDVVVTADR